VCRVFAPVYRQGTLTSLVAGTTTAADGAMAFADVLDAWKHYIANDNGGRGVLLIGHSGHSQGASILTALIKSEIDPNPDLRGRLVSAMLLGTSLQVPDGKDVGGDFANVPLCHTPHDTGCAITYGSFRSTAPPPSNSKGDPSDPRIDDSNGDLTPEWGMHLIDVNVAMGDLVSLARSEGKAFRRH
jgi:Protein of unknown function (DUF3089)